jgi:ubiquinone/menaquinone biosynthesis C-methylase UbiE
MSSKRYSDFYRTNFGMEILKREVEFIEKELSGCKRILSIGCGPALHEVQLARSSPDIELIGLDISKDMLSQAPKLPKNVDLILGGAEQLPLRNESIDLVYFMTSLEFTSDVESALNETKRVMKPGGKAIFMVANIKSWYVQKELAEVDSYIKRNYENMDAENLKKIISRYLEINSMTLMLGIRGENIFDSEDPNWASLIVLKTTK